MEANTNTFKKNERLCSQVLISQLFEGESKSLSVYPLRLIYQPVERTTIRGVSLLISVSKKKFHNAVDRNHVKRQIRESYRKNKQGLLAVLEKQNIGASIAIVYVSDTLLSSEEMTKKTTVLLCRLIAKFQESC